MLIGLTSARPTFSQVKVTAHGAEIHTAAGDLKLTAWTNDCIRVQFLPTGIRSESVASSLPLIGSPKKLKLSYRRTTDEFIMTTAHMRAQVSLKDGQVSFYDKAGHLITSEAGRRFLNPATIGKGIYPVTQSFSMRPDEGLYGLGQHQQPILDENGQSVMLQQENREVAIPMLVSNRGYGIMWDNPSVTEVDLGARAEPIPPANVPGEWHALFYSGEDFGKLLKTETVPSVDFNWSQTPPSGVPHDNYTVRWTGTIVTDAAGNYNFSTTSDDGARLWVNGKKIIDNWTVHPATIDRGTIHLKAHTKYPVKLEYFQGGFDAIIKLGWSVPQPHPKITWRSEYGNAVDYFVMNGPTPAKVIQQYRYVTGSAPLFPEWAYGYWQCKEHYNTQTELVDVLKKYRQIGVPIDGIIQDWFYWNPFPWGSHKFDPKRYPDPAKMVSDVHNLHGHIMISVWAKFQAGSANYDALNKIGALYPKTGDARYYDPFSSQARSKYWSQVNNSLFRLGFDGFWLDASEPELSGAWGEFRSIKTADGLGARVYNAYPLMHTEAVYEGWRATKSPKRVFLLTRSAYLGQQHNAAVTWSGDIQADWRTLQTQIPAGLNFCMSGIPYWNTDIGGFFSRDPKDPDYAECFTRWYEFGAFCPMFRVHGTNFPKEIWRFAPAIQTVLAKYDRLHYSLIPYTYDQAWQVYKNGSLLMRPLAYDFPNDPADAKIIDQFMYGPSLMICPVVKPKMETRPVYLPKGADWYDFWTGKKVSGGQTIQANSPLDQEPIYVRAGSIIPMDPPEQWTGQHPGKLNLDVYPGKDGETVFYRDAGDGYGYEKGQYATVRIVWNEAKHQLTLEPRKGAYPGMVSRIAVTVRLMGSETTKTKLITYTGTKKSVRL